MKSTSPAIRLHHASMRPSAPGGRRAREGVLVAPSRPGLQQDAVHPHQRGHGLGAAARHCPQGSPTLAARPPARRCGCSGRRGWMLSPPRAGAAGDTDRQAGRGPMQSWRHPAGAWAARSAASHDETQPPRRQVISVCGPVLRTQLLAVGAGADGDDRSASPRRPNDTGIHRSLHLRCVPLPSTATVSGGRPSLEPGARASEGPCARWWNPRPRSSGAARGAKTRRSRGQQASRSHANLDISQVQRRRIFAQLKAPALVGREGGCGCVTWRLSPCRWPNRALPGVHPRGGPGSTSNRCR